VFTNGPLTAEMNQTILDAYPDGFTLLAAEDIPIDQRKIVSLVKIGANADDESILMVFEDGSSHTTNSLLWRPKYNQTNSFAGDLNLEFNTNHPTIKTAADGTTSVKGVYSAGDAGSNLRCAPLHGETDLG
jgi:thioredoxin reductase